MLRRLRLYPNRALEFLDGSGRETELGNEDSEDGIEVFGVVMYCVNDMRSCEWDDLPVVDDRSLTQRSGRIYPESIRELW
ncbi:hypothetical protein M8494_14485 [Serratia ureilytica]